MWNQRKVSEVISGQWWSQTWRSRCVEGHLSTKVWPFSDFCILYISKGSASSTYSYPQVQYNTVVSSIFPLLLAPKKSCLKQATVYPQRNHSSGFSPIALQRDLGASNLKSTSDQTQRCWKCFPKWDLSKERGNSLENQRLFPVLLPGRHYPGQIHLQRTSVQ